MINFKDFMEKFNKPMKKAIEEEKNFYGGDKTIHDTGHVDVVLDEAGNVSAVWFRCAYLPFKQSERRVPVSDVPQFLNEDVSRIKGIVFEGE